MKPTMRAGLIVSAAIVLTTAAPAGAAAASEAGYLARLGVDYGYQLNAESQDYQGLIR
ncbi:hypothetical protein SEA_FROSTY24_58 [Mycobacterium phage Frosty24]|nr:hypothetical protein SEA_FROSTY24_58 [Mycobacterium phage Frosty24]